MSHLEGNDIWHISFYLFGALGKDKEESTATIICHSLMLCIKKSKSAQECWNQCVMTNSAKNPPQFYNIDEDINLQNYVTLDNNHKT